MIRFSDYFQLILSDANINCVSKVGSDGVADLLVAQVRTSMIVHDILHEEVNIVVIGGCLYDCWYSG